MNKMLNCSKHQSDNAAGYNPAYEIGRSRSAMLGLLMIMLLIPSAWAAAPSSSVSDMSNYELSLGDLNKVRKERPVNRGAKERKKKRDEGAVQRKAPDAAASSQKADLPPVTTPGATGNAASNEAMLPGQAGQGVSGSTGAPGGAQAPPLPVSIHHDPYSYVIAGKRTTIQAVISSVNGIRTVSCRFRAVENGAYALVPMVLSPGTHFTYAAVLPGLSSASRTLRYTISAVDSSGKEVLSPEFVIAAKSSSVLPGWQLENSADVIRIRLEQKEKPLEGFSDPGMAIE